MQRKNILFIVPRFGTVNRGVESFSQELITRLDKSKFNITVLSAQHEIEIESVNFIKTDTLKRESFKWIDQSTLVQKILRQADLGSGSDIEALILCINAAKYLKKQTFDIVIPLGGTWTYRFSKYYFKKAKIVSIGQAGPVRRDLKLSNFFVALTPFDEKRAQEILPSISTVVIPNGVDLNKFKPGTHKSEADIKTILCVAALSQDKRHDLLFDAVMLLPKNIRVLCIGDGPHKSVLEQHQLVFAGRVEFRAVNYKDMPEIYHQADIFSLASPEEAFGIVFLEAIASGLPVVAHNGSRQQFVVGQNGILTNCYSANTYAESLISILERKLDKKSVELLDFDKFNWERVSRSYESLFHELGGI